MNFDFNNTQRALNQAIEYLKQEYLQISTGRANPSLLDGIYIETYGTRQPIKNIASITLEDARTLKVTPWEKNQIQTIEKALHESHLPFSISVADSGIRVHIPQLTEESKKSLVKLVKEKLEDARVKVRNARQETMKEIDASESSEDEKKRNKEILQKHTDEANKNLEEVFEKKEADIMKV